MSWKTIDRNKAVDAPGQPVLCEALRDKIRSLFPRYETRRAVILAALHMIQDDLNHISQPAMQELAEILEIPASDVFDTISFYSQFWTKPRGEKVVMVCRSISCEVMGSGRVLAECKKVLGIGEHETTADGKFSLVTEECLAACDHAPCMIINEKMHKRIKPGDVRAILNDPDNDRLDMPRSDLYDGVGTNGKNTNAAATAPADAESADENQ